MLTDIMIKTNKIDCKFHDLTNNTIILCDKPSVKNRLYEKISRIWRTVDDRIDDGVTYIYDPYDENPEYNHDSDMNMQYLNTTIAELCNGQSFILTTEYPFLFHAERPGDLWFAEEDKNGKIVCWAFTEFVGYKKIWNEGSYNLYKKFMDGCFGIIK